MQVSKEAVLQILRLLFSDSKFRIGLFSVGGFLLLKRVVWNYWSAWNTESKYEARRLQAEARKKLAFNHSQKAQNLDLIKKPLDSLVDAVKSGKTSAQDVLLAMMKKALLVNKEINAITEPILESVDQAKNFDPSSNPTGLLCGIPVSLKENIGIEGYDTTAGAEGRINVLAKEDSVIVKVLKFQGAIPFARTNLAQSLMSYCSETTLYGTTRNPHDKTRSPGGSSSGEGALIAAGGSIIGIGTDSGGSIRVPGEFCGIYTLKTTVGRISKKGVYTARKGRLAIEGCLGPMARDFDSLLLLTRALLCDEMYALDPKLAPLPFNKQIYDQTGPLRIGYYTYDGNMKCQPPNIRAVTEAKAALERKGHELMEIDFCETFKPPFEPGKFFNRIMIADRAERIMRDTAKDKQSKVLEETYVAMKRPAWYWHLMCRFMSDEKRFEREIMRGMAGFSSVNEFWDHVAEFLGWQEAFMKSWMNMGLDAIVCPVYPCPAVKLDINHKATSCGSYCQLYNSLNYPSGTMPVTKVTKDDVARTLNPDIHKPTTGMGKLMMKNVEGMEGLPVGVQCVALPFREEMCLRVMRDLDTELRK